MTEEEVRALQARGPTEAAERAKFPKGFQAGGELYISGGVLYASAVAADVRGSMIYIKQATELGAMTWRTERLASTTYYIYLTKDGTFEVGNEVPEISSVYVGWYDSLGCRLIGSFATAVDKSVSSATVVSVVTFDHDKLENSHNLTTDIDHDELTNTHNLTTDIDHDELTNTHNLTSDIDHNLVLHGHLPPKAVTKTADYTILDTDTDTIYFCAPASAAMEIELPTAADNANAVLSFVQANSSYETTITPESGEDVNDTWSALYLNKAGQRVMLFCDGSNWWVMDGQPSYMSGHIALGGGQYMIPNSARPSTWAVNGSTADSATLADWSSYVPAGVRAITLNCLLRLLGNGTLDSVTAYTYPYGGSATGAVEDRLNSFYAVDVPNDQPWGHLIQAEILCSSDGKFYYWMNTSRGQLYLNPIGYSMGV